MVLDDEHVEPLREHLEKALADPGICDADPKALSAYVIALLQRDQPLSELKQSCSEKLEEFLQKQTASFVAELFTWLDSRLALSAENAEDDAEGGETHKRKRRRSRSRSKSRSRSRSTERSKRKVEKDKDGKDRKSRRSGRREDDEDRDRRRKRGKRDREGHRDRPEDPRFRDRKTTSVNGTRASGRKRRCRDYDYQGYCIQGEQCPYDHGTDPFVVTDVSKFPLFKQNQKIPDDQYDPERASFDPKKEKNKKSSAAGGGPPFRPVLRPIPANPMNLNGTFRPGAPRDPRVKGSAGPAGGKPPPGDRRKKPSGSPPNGSPGNPPGPGPKPWRGAPTRGGGRFMGPPPPRGPLRPGMERAPLRYDPNHGPPRGMVMPPRGIPRVGPDGHLPPGHHPSGPGPRGPYGPRGGFVGRGPGPRDEDREFFHGDDRPRGPIGPGMGRRDQGRREVRKSTTNLYISKLPPECCNVVRLTEHFKAFGEIVNARVNKDKGEGFVQFGSPEEANAALASPKSVLGNRFIRVVFARAGRFDNHVSHRHPLQKRNSPDTGHGPDLNFKIETSGKGGRKVRNVHASEETKAEVKETPATLINTTLINTPKKSSSNAQAKAKKGAELARLKSDLLKKQIKQQKDMLAMIATMKNKKEKSEMLKVLAKLGKQIEQGLAESKIMSKNSPKITSPRKKVVSPANSPAAADAAGKKKEWDRLRKEKLDRELDSIITGEVSVPSEAHSKSGRGRGGRVSRSSRGGRGRSERRSTLDRRTKILKVRNPPEEATKEALRTHFQAFGTVTSIESTPDSMLVEFATRREAEVASANGRAFRSHLLATAFFDTAAKKKQEFEMTKRETHDVVEHAAQQSNQGDPEMVIAHLSSDEDDDSDEDKNWKRS